MYMRNCWVSCWFPRFNFARWQKQFQWPKNFGIIQFRCETIGVDKFQMREAMTFLLCVNEGGNTTTKHLVCLKVLSLIDWVFAFHAPEWQSIVETINNFFRLTTQDSPANRETFHPSARLLWISSIFFFQTFTWTQCWLIDRSCHSVKLKFKFSCY